MTPSRQILIADDDGDLRLLVRLHFHLRGDQVLEAGDGQQAIAQLSEHRPDVVLLDLRMPDLTGWDVLEWMRARGMLEHTPVIVVSAHAGQREARRVLAAGAAAFVHKPLRLGELDALVDEYAAP